MHKSIKEEGMRHMASHECATPAAGCACPRTSSDAIARKPVRARGALRELITVRRVHCFVRALRKPLVGLNRRAFFPSYERAALQTHRRRSTHTR